MGRQRRGTGRKILFGMDCIGGLSVARRSDQPRLQRFRDAGGRRAVVSTIQLGPTTDLGATREMLGAFATAGFDDAVVMLMPGGPTAADVRRLL